MVEWLWLQKSRLNWNLKGDRNTRFFHVLTKGRQSRNEISSISIGNAVCEDPAQVRQEIFQQFRKLYSEDRRVNGSPTEEFSPQKGLRPGDPLSPFLFNIAAKGLNILLSRAQQIGLIKGVKVGSSGVLLSHLQFTDDSILFCEAEEMEVCNIKRVLRAFSLKYLGMPLGANSNKKATWKLVLDKVKCRLVGWKRKLLSFSGRLALLKSITSALPWYYLSLFIMPIEVAKEFEKLQAAFPWGGSASRKPIHVVKWDEVAKSVKQGELDNMRVRLVNDCMLLKWGWRFGKEKDALWKKIICIKYNLDVKSWFPSSSSSSRYSCVWKGIASLPERRNNLIMFFSINVQVKIGDGQSTNYWKDKWGNNYCLKDEFPILYRLVMENDETLRSM
ncbi:uncharacterized protein LOC114282472 [Camellia sinensis]|uniref:uncharacterized protein LOC114282472 n=1 Tax=Camellia sinensis TaxID=4442 RepID=UPI001036C152|nr:uncharacterized protein LOC114282472 [Camellia sinensis]